MYKELQRKIRQWNKLKKRTPKKTELRRKILRKLRELKKAVKISSVCSPEKAKLIQKIYTAEPNIKQMRINLNKYTIEQLQYHYNTKIKNKTIKELRDRALF